MFSFLSTFVFSVSIVLCLLSYVVLDVTCNEFYVHLLFTSTLILPSTATNSSTLLILFVEPFVLFQNDQTLEYRLIWEELVRAQFCSVAGSNSDGGLVSLELVY